MTAQPETTSKTHMFSPTILREYDIRGQVDINLNKHDAYALGLAYGTYVRRENNGKTGLEICLGFDGRHSSPALAEALSRGLRETGANVTNIGLGPSPMLYFAVKHRKAAAGVMVTGSHNPSDYNGFKMGLYAAPVFGETIQHIGKIAETGDFEVGAGAEQSVDVRADYIARLLQDLTAGTDYKIAWDAGNGAAGKVLQMLTAKLDGEHHVIYSDIDGDFPNHHPDPTVDENLADLIALVKEKNCDFGIGFDGDGDRIGVVDNEGNILRCDMLMTLYARSVLEAYPGAAIIGDVKCSQTMFDEINKMGGKGVMWKTGHSLIKSKMAELDAPLAGELSGHIFFNDIYYGFDDALYCAIRLINEVAAQGKRLSEMTAHLRGHINTPEVRFEVDQVEKFELVPRIFESLQARRGNFEINDIDGVRVSNADGWWLLRPSNTQDVLVARAESTTQEGLERLCKMAREEVAKIGYTLPL